MLFGIFDVFNEKRKVLLLILFLGAILKIEAISRQKKEKRGTLKSLSSQPEKPEMLNCLRNLISTLNVSLRKHFRSLGRDQQLGVSQHT